MQLFAESFNNGINIRQTDIAYPVFIDGFLQNILNNIAFIGILRFFIQNPAQPAQKSQVLIGRLHKRESPLQFEIRRNPSVFTVNAFALYIRRNFRKAFFARDKDVAAQRIQTANQRAGGMNAATQYAQEDTGSVFFTIQHRSVITGVASDKRRSGHAQNMSQARNFIRIHLNLLVAATLAAFHAPK